MEFQNGEEEMGGAPKIKFGFNTNASVAGKRKRSIRMKKTQEEEGKDKQELKEEITLKQLLGGRRKKSRFDYLESRQLKKLRELKDDLTFEEELMQMMSTSIGGEGRFRFTKEELEAYERKRNVYNLIMDKTILDAKDKESFYMLPGSPKRLGELSTMPPSASSTTGGSLVAFNSDPSTKIEEKHSLAQWEDVQLAKTTTSNPLLQPHHHAQQFPYVFDPLEAFDAEERLAAPSSMSDAPGSPADEAKLHDLLSDLMQIQPDPSATPQQQSLPIAAHREELLASVRDHPVLIVVGETGSGKSTQIPQYLFDSLRAEERMLQQQGGRERRGEGEGCSSRRRKKIGITQPRRVAAMSLAKRVAEEMGERLGGLVGYSIRFEERLCESTRVVYMTDGMLLRELLRDPTLSDYAYIIIDEAHERSLHTDVLLPLLKDLVKYRQQEAERRRGEEEGEEDDAFFRLLISSATLEADKFSRYFEGAKVLNIPGRVYPVDIFYAVAPVVDPIAAAVDTALRIHVENRGDMTNPNRDILVFLPGQEEIESAIELLEERLREYERTSRSTASKLRENLMVLPCYSVLPSEQQVRIFEKTPPDTRKVVFATNIAETSLTIDGIAYVVDSGYCKRKEFSPRESMDVLAVSQVSRANADQRAGRAGRVAPGKAYRLYTKFCYERELDAVALPEMQRAHLGSVLLFLSSMGIKDFLSFDFMDPPSVEAITTALEELYALGALNDKGEITSTGRKMAELPVEPCMAKALVCSTGTTTSTTPCSLEMIRLCGMLSVSHSLFVRPRRGTTRQQAENAHRELFHPRGDHLTLLNIYERWKESNYSRQWCIEYFLQFRSLNRARQIVDQLISFFERNDWPVVSAADAAHLYTLATPTLSLTSSQMPEEEVVTKCFLSGYFLHAARLQKRGGFYLPINRKKTPIRIHPQSALFGKPPMWVVYHHLLETSDKFMREVSEIEPQWIVDVAPHFFEEVNKEGGVDVDASGEKKQKKKKGNTNNKPAAARMRESMAMAASKRKMERVSGRAGGV